ncbi:MAG: hypothetical protein UX60_C0005G0008 [Berkelbacteria bacterium GW2011_GWA2_46_7]|uniref:Uncharacterized protein n=1 Tax=Berkelbacteria bacterium GW2011_GWA2_46_7 TaxID=1618335 RepID=A0A0G1QHX6_9BACT|nr:MAG: hypothetical protein UX60_C0005G0008 [Berkelbacteria bacterium GW2011_GWA2_46_7]
MSRLHRMWRSGHPMPDRSDSVRSEASYLDAEIHPESLTREPSDLQKPCQLTSFPIQNAQSPTISA